MPFLLSFFASISTLIGIIPIYIKQNQKIILCSLAFASGVMLSVSLFDLVKEAYILFGFKYSNFISILFILIFMNIGIVLSCFIDHLIPNSGELYRVGVISMIAIIMHNIPEGIATFITSESNITLGISLTIAIAAHNIPEGITIALPIYYATNKKRRAILYTFISGFSEFFGTIIAYLFLRPFVNNIVLGLLYSMIAGIMIYIVFYEIFPFLIKNKNYFLMATFFLIGVVFTLSI